jgi:hypothetical protein
MKVVSITVGASHKLSIPGAYETVNPSISMTAEVEEGEDLAEAIQKLKTEVDMQFWRAAYVDFFTACNRRQQGTENWLRSLSPKQ